MAPLERAMIISYLHCDRCAICNHSAAICDRMSPTLKSTGDGWLWAQNLGVFPLEQTRQVGVAKSEHPTLTNGEIIFEEFQPMWSQFTNVTDSRTDRQTTCDRNTALCTKVHRAVMRTEGGRKSNVSRVARLTDRVVRDNVITNFLLILTVKEI